MEFSYVKDMLIGTLLGDGSIEKQSVKCNTYTIGVTQCNSKESNYIEHKHSLLKEYFDVLDIAPAHNNTKRFRFSRSEKDLIDEMTELTRYEDNSRKIPDIDVITDIVLLYWYLDDGSLSIIKQKRPNGRKPSIHRKLRIALSSFRDEDILIFLEKLNSKFNLNFRPFYEHNKIISIGISNNLFEIIKFLDIINPYKKFIPKEMHYKFCLCYHHTKTLKDDNLIKYNSCNVHKTGICTCRNRDLTEIFV